LTSSFFVLFLKQPQSPKCRTASQDFEVRGQTRILHARLRRVAGSGVQDIRSMKQRFRKANLVITHVLDSCTKLVVVLHISSVQGRPVHLSATIATGRRRTTDLLTTLNLLTTSGCLTRAYKSQCHEARGCEPHTAARHTKYDRRWIFLEFPESCAVVFRVIDTSYQ